MKRWAVPWLFLLVAVALVLRGGDLALRPLHNDEAINAFKLQRLWTHGEYRYDPEEYHGPALYYFALPVLAVAEVVRPGQPDEVGLRWVTVLFGVGLILLLILMADGLGWPSVLGAALFTAVSPAFVYYSRYFIHEMLLVSFTSLVLGAFWRYLRKPGLGWALTVGTGVGLMYATKETFVFSIAAMGLAWVGTAGLMGIFHDSQDGGEGFEPGRVAPTRWRRFRAWLVPELGGHRFMGSDLFRKELLRVHEPGTDGLLSVPDWGRRGLRPSRGRFMGRQPVLLGHAIAALGAAALVAAILFTSFFRHPAGAWDAVRTYLIWLERAGGASPHVHPWHFYLERLFWFHPRHGPVWSEGAILLFAVLGVAGAWWRKTPDVASRWLVSFLALYTLGLATIYCVLPYKTPWCLLGAFHGVLLLAGVGVATLFQAGRSGWWRAAAGLALGAVVVHLTVQTWRASWEYPADSRNPYAYGQTSADIFNLLDQVNEIAEVHPDGRRMTVMVMAPESAYWPLPWYLRRFEQVGWWDKVPDESYAPVMIVASKLGASIEEKSNKQWLMVGMFELRPRFFVELYVQSDLWTRFLEARAAARRKEAG